MRDPLEAVDIDKRRAITYVLIAIGFGVVLAVAVLGTLQTALTQDLMPAQDQNIVVGSLLLASVIVPNASEMYRRARTRLRSWEARRHRAAAAREPWGCWPSSAAPAAGRSP